MSNPNIITVYAPNGEAFEMSRANARDLTNHAGWTYPNPDGKPPVTPIEADNGSTDSAGSIEDGKSSPAEDGSSEEVAAGQEASPVQGAGEEGHEEVAAEQVTTVRKTEAEFADLPEREDVVAYLADAFPDFKPHHLAKRESLIAKAVELATAE